MTETLEKRVVEGAMPTTVRKTRAERAAELLVQEVMRAYVKWPVGTDNPLQHVSIITEELGEIARTLNDAWNSGKAWRTDFRKELIQTGAMCIRALMEIPARQPPDTLVDGPRVHAAKNIEPD